MRDEARQEHVISLVNQINNVLVGEEMAEAQTALTIAVVCQMVALTEDKFHMIKMSRGFAKQLENFMQREDIVEWVKCSITPFTGTKRVQ